MLKKVLSAIFIATLTFGLSINAYALSNGKVNVAILNVRSGPSTTQSIVTKVYKNNTVTILETKGNWHKIKLSNGKTGWAPKSNLTTLVTKSGKVNTTVLSVRSGPSSAQSIIANIYKNNIVTVLDTKGDWYNVKLSNGRIGWVSKIYITIVIPPVDDTSGPSDDPVTPAPPTTPTTPTTPNTPLPPVSLIWSEAISGDASPNNTSSRQYFAKEGDWIYYFNYSDKCIYKIKTNGTGKTMFLNPGSPNGSSIAVKNGYLYYTVHYADNNKQAEVWRIKVDGTDKKRIDSIYSTNQWYNGLNFYKDNIYYNSATWGVHYSKLDGSSNNRLTFKPRYIGLWDNKFYYADFRDNDNIYEMNLDTNEIKKINSNESTEINLYNGYIYFINRDDNNKIYRTKIGGNTEKVCDETTYDMKVDNGWIYYGNEKDDNKLYKIKIDGTGKTKLSEDSSWNMQIFGNWVFYTKYGVKEYYAVKIDGSLKYRIN